MKYTTKMYANAFCDVATDAKNTANADKYIKNLLLLVKSNRDQKKLKDILSVVEKIIIKKTGGRKLTIESARPLTQALERTIKSIAKPTDIVERKINNQLIAGIKVNINDEFMLDGSFSTKIKKILKI